MNKSSVKRLEQLHVDDVVRLLEIWQQTEFEEFVREKEIDGRKIIDVTEGIVKLWRPKINAKKFMLFIEDLKGNVDKYLNGLTEENDIKDDPKDIPIECQYQTVLAKKVREEQIAATTLSNVEELLKKLVPAKSFLYRNQQRPKDKTGPSYLPMDSGTKKPRRFFRLSYDYPQFDIFSRFSKQENFDDRGYYSVKTNQRHFIQRTYKRQETKYKSISTTEELHDRLPEDHFYEDLCYNDIYKNENKAENLNTNEIVQVKPALVKIQELFQSFKMPFFRKVEMAEEDKTTESDIVEKDVNTYENDTVADMYDSIHVPEPDRDKSVDKTKTYLPVEDYLEPVQLNKDYCDVGVRQKEDSILGYIMSMFENRFGIRRETNDPTQSEDSEDDKPGPPLSEEPRKWGEDRRPRANMADRPLPVPVENEAYYMNIDRAEAENLLMGQPDGTFVLRPSSQSTHAYTLSVSCSNAVHNVGVRRRPDGRLALGFARRGERSFTSVTSLLRHHRRRRLLLVAAGGVIGATTLNETPHYYQTPSNLPLVLSESVNEDQATSSVDLEVGAPLPEELVPEVKNGHTKILQRIETVPDIKRDTSGITTQYVATGIVNLGAFASGACVAWSASALPLLTAMEVDHTAIDLSPSNGTHTRFMLTASQASWTASLLCLGALFGAVPTGLISEYFGRKKTLLYLALPLVVSWILVASSPSVSCLYVGRFVGGIAVGAFSVGIPPYVEDISEPQLRSTLANFFHVHFSCGILFGYIIGMVPSITWLSILCALVPVGFFVAFIFLPESPTYLLSQGKYSEAKTALRYYRGIDNNIDSEIKELKEQMRNYVKHKVTFKELFSTKATVKALIVSFGLMIFQQMSGIYPVIFYVQKILSTFKISMNLPSAAIILGFCLVSSTYFSTMLLKSVRRRVLLVTSFTLMAISLGLLATYYHLQASKMCENNTWVPLFCLCMFVSVYASGVGPIPWLMLREIFPRNVTRRATAITAGFHWFLAFAVTNIFQNLVLKVQPGWALWYFAVICFVGTLFVFFFVPETKGRTLEEIQNEFDGIHKKKKHIHVIEVESVSET